MSTIERVSPAGAGPTWSRSLTTRELVVLGARSEVVTPQGIASELSVPRTTVTSRVRSLYRKLGVSNRTGAISWAQTAGRRRPSIPSRGSGCPDPARVGAVHLAPLAERTDRILARLLGCSAAHLADPGDRDVATAVERAGAKPGDTASEREFVACKKAATSAPPVAGHGSFVGASLGARMLSGLALFPDGSGSGSGRARRAAR